MGEPNGIHPLEGISVLVTRSVEQSAGLVGELTSKGAQVWVIPAVATFPLPEPEGLDRALARMDTYDNVIFTSVNGVAFTNRLLSRVGLKPGDLPPALCVGEKTAGAWEKSGGNVSAVPDKFTARALLDTLEKDLKGRSYLVMRPEVVKTELGRELSHRGAAVDEIVLYRTIVPEEGTDVLDGLMAAGGPDVVFFASPSAVEGTVGMAAQSPKPEAQRKVATQNEEPGTRDSGRGIFNIPAICIGPTTAKAAEEAGFTEVYFPDEHTAEEMVNELLVIAGRIKKSRDQSVGTVICDS
jgi:uroporphyrinogen III methyltransferase/synthase